MYWKVVWSQRNTNLHTSSHEDVVSLPVKRYWPIKRVSPFLTACIYTKKQFTMQYFKNKGFWGRRKQSQYKYFNRCNWKDKSLLTLAQVSMKIILMTAFLHESHKIKRGPSIENHMINVAIWQVLTVIS